MQFIAVTLVEPKLHSFVILLRVKEHAVPFYFGSFNVVFVSIGKPYTGYSVLRTVWNISRQ